VGAILRPGSAGLAVSCHINEANLQMMAIRFRSLDRERLEEARAQPVDMFQTAEVCRDVYAAHASPAQQAWSAAALTEWIDGIDQWRGRTKLPIVEHPSLDLGMDLIRAWIPQSYVGTAIPTGIDGTTAQSTLQRIPFDEIATRVNPDSIEIISGAFKTMRDAIQLAADVELHERIELLQDPTDEIRLREETDESPPNAADYGVSDRELDWLQRLSRGERGIDIAVRHGYSERDFYRAQQRLWQKLKVPGRNHALVLAARNGWTDDAAL
jgi:DNA-binding CsgD family transcriptional regulator